MSDHFCNADTCPEGANYFVTCTDAGRLWYMAGPYRSHGAALAALDPARAIGVANDGRAHFYAWGTVSSSRIEPGSITAAGLLP